MPRLTRLVPAILLLVALPSPGPGQAVDASGGPPAHGPARISEEIRSLPTYPFSEPNPVPILARDVRLYPYHAFEGYAATSEPRNWKVVTLENDWIRVFVLPEVGGKVWGAVVKETGHEFVYRNEVMKFRNIALRGPWTSGGIEFNFGVVGHTPSAATPVDYALRENPDGSVSCWVGAMDLPSRTHWRVEIRLPADRAAFETNVLWFNPTPLEQPYYAWMTAAASARDDLAMWMPGTMYVDHPGTPHPWPVDGEGRYLPLYANNRFGGHKSYHVVGELHDVFGGYYGDAGWGFGHWSHYEEMPGQKLWLWALSREGAVWEELLTDTDGQYVEFQAGRLFVQYTPGAAVNPVTQVGFEPLSASRWSETWFPVEGLGGLTAASPLGALHARLDGSRLTVSAHAFGAVADTLEVWSGDRRTAAVPAALRPLEPVSVVVEVDPARPWRVRMPVLGLEWESDPSARRLSRPFRTDPDAWARIPDADRLAFAAAELAKGRRYGPARASYAAALEREPWHRGALLGMAALHLRSAEYEAGLERARRVLQLDAYDPGANFLAGLLARALGRTADARDAFGWAARSVAYRAAARVELSELAIREGRWSEAARHARLAVEADRRSVPAWRALAVIGRRSGDATLAVEARSELLTIDPLHHFARAEEYLGGGPAHSFLERLGGEFPDQSLLELAIGYANLGLPDDALSLLALPPGAAPGPVQVAWRAYLSGDAALLGLAPGPDFAFPYRPETLVPLGWAAERSDDWMWSYLLALNLWAVDRRAEAAERLEALEDRPAFGPAYAARAHLRQELRGTDPVPDLRRAVALAPGERILRVTLVRALQAAGRHEEALDVTGEALARFPGDFDLELLRARSLLELGRPGDAAALLAATRVLPSENARDSHRLWEQAHAMAALDALDAGDPAAARRHALAAMEWPETLGQGRPYEPEERLPRAILGAAEAALGHAEAARAALEAVAAGGDPAGDAGGETAASRPPGRPDLFRAPALRALGRDAEADAELRVRGEELRALRAGLDADLEGRTIRRALAHLPPANGVDRR